MNVVNICIFNFLCWRLEYILDIFSTYSWYILDIFSIYSQYILNIFSMYSRYIVDIFFYIPQLENEQQKIVMVLTMRKKEFEVIDIMKPGNQVRRSTNSNILTISNQNRVDLSERLQIMIFWNLFKSEYLYSIITIIFTIFQSESPNLHARSWQEKGRAAKCFASADFQRGRLYWGERKMSQNTFVLYCQYYF